MGPETLENRGRIGATTLSPRASDDQWDDILASVDAGWLSQRRRWLPLHPRRHPDVIRKRRWRTPNRRFSPFEPQQSVRRVKIALVLGDYDKQLSRRAHPRKKFHIKELLVSRILIRGPFVKDHNRTIFDDRPQKSNPPPLSRRKLGRPSGGDRHHQCFPIKYQSR